ncbi:MAG: hypothetical protein GY788_05565 [bacterium]|nr:hypothetical protein [bacterium]
MTASEAGTDPSTSSSSSRSDSGEAVGESELESMWRRRAVRRSAAWVFIPASAAVVVAGVALALDPSSVESNQVGELTGMTTFILGVLVAFSLDRSRTRLSTIAEMLKRQDAALSSIRSLVVIFPGDEPAVAALIDAHLQDQVDYRIPDFAKTSESFGALADRVRDIYPSSTRE